MLSHLHQSFVVLASEPKAESDLIASVQERFPNVPDEYIKLVGEVTELELQHANGQYLRIWGPSGCLDQDDGYGISKRIPGAIPIGDDGGGHVILFLHGHHGFGLYHVGYGDIDAEDAIWIAESLNELLTEGKGISSF